MTEISLTEDEFAPLVLLLWELGYVDSKGLRAEAVMKMIGHNLNEGDESNLTALTEKFNKALNDGEWYLNLLDR